MAAQQSGKFTVLFDSGIRSGSDIIKAVALGANAVLRAYLVGISRMCSHGTELNFVGSGTAIHVRSVPWWSGGC